MDQSSSGHSVVAVFFPGIYRALSGEVGAGVWVVAFFSRVTTGVYFGEFGGPGRLRSGWGPVWTTTLFGSGSGGMDAMGLKRSLHRGMISSLLSLGSGILFKSHYWSLLWRIRMTWTTPFGLGSCLGHNTVRIGVRRHGSHPSRRGIVSSRFSPTWNGCSPGNPLAPSW